MQCIWWLVQCVRWLYTIKVRLVYCKDLYCFCNVPVTKNKCIPMVVASNEACLWWHLIFSILLPIIEFSAHFFPSRSSMKLFWLSLTETEVLLFPENKGVWGASLTTFFLCIHHSTLDSKIPLFLFLILSPFLFVLIVRILFTLLGNSFSCATPVTSLIT